MNRECGDYRQEFNSLSRPRLHECPGSQPADTVDEVESNPTDEPAGGQTEDPGLDREQLEREYPDVVGDLPSLFDDAQDGDAASLSRAIAE